MRLLGGADALVLRSARRSASSAAPSDFFGTHVAGRVTGEDAEREGDQDDAEGEVERDHARAFREGDVLTGLNLVAGH